MKSLLVHLALLLATSACLSGGAPAPKGPVEWPTGGFTLQGTVQYGRSTGNGTRMTATDSYVADVFLENDGTMNIECSAGGYRALSEDPKLVADQMRRGERSFFCGGAIYTVRPAGSTLQGQLQARVTETTRERAGCATYDENGACVEYAYNYKERSRTATAPLRVGRKG